MDYQEVIGSLILAGLSKPKLVPKQWGHEIWFANDERHQYCGKLLYIKENSNFSMHFHKEKTETFYVLTGKVLLRVVDFATGHIESKVLEMGDVFNIKQELPHELTSLEGPATIIEVSTFHKDSDSYRLWRANE